MAGLGQILGHQLRFKGKKRQVDTYYDTDSHHLLRVGACLRVRDDGEGLRVTFKSGPQGIGVFVREELEVEIGPHDEDHLMQLDIPPVQEAIRTLGVSPSPSVPTDENRVAARWYERRLAAREPEFVPVLRVENHRRTIELLKGSDVRFEMALDQGVFERADRNSEEPFCELEIEVVFGDEEELQRVANYLEERFKLRPQQHYKCERGMGVG